MVAVTTPLDAVPAPPVTTAETPRSRSLGVVPTASMVTGGGFGFGIPVPPRKLSHHTGFQRWAHQLWLDVSSATFWKSVAHHYLRMIYDILATVIALALLAVAIVEPALAMAISGSDDALDLSFVSPPLAWLLAFIALVAAVAILVFAPAVDG